MLDGYHDALAQAGHEPWVLTVRSADEGGREGIRAIGGATRRVAELFDYVKDQRPYVWIVLGNQNVNRDLRPERRRSRHARGAAE